jgi:hypothetical protein
MVKIASTRDHGEGVGGAHSRATGAGREEGAILILALAYLVAVSLVVAFLSTWATNDLNNSTAFSSANSLTLAATDMTEVAIQYVRYNPLISTSQAPGLPGSAQIACWGGGGNSTQTIPVINGDQVAVWCSTVWNPSTAQTRDVTFDACPVSVSDAQCTGNNVLLTSEVDFDDYPPPPANSALIQDLCSTWCGSGMEILSWHWGSSTPDAAVGIATAVTFSADPSPTTVDGATTAAVKVTDNGVPVPNDTVAIFESTGPTSGITSGKSTLTAVTNASGIAEFTNIVPQAVGSYVLTAEVAPNLQSTSTQFKVNPARSTFTNISTIPTGATVKGTPYLPSAQATSGDTVAITLDSSSTGCTLTTVKGVLTVSFTAAGTCVLDFNDAGNANYSAAFQVTQSFPVGGSTATNVTIALSTTTPAASSTTNVGITLTLRNSSGAIVTSSGITTVVLSDIGSGNFASALGATGASTLNVNFANGASTATADFGNENTGQDTISVVSGSTTWGTANLTIQGGAATQVAISEGPSSPTVSSVTNTSITFQLEDAYGNIATSNGTTTLALSDSGNGFFATSNGAPGASTLNVTFANDVGTATAYFGNETSGSDTIVAKNGATTWGTSTFTLAAGAATTVQITLTPAPTTSKLTNTAVSVQLLDQFGNHAITSGVSFTLSNSGAGFFATTSGINAAGGSTTLTVSTNASGVAVGFFGDDTAQSDTITASGTGIKGTTAPFTV